MGCIGQMTPNLISESHLNMLLKNLGIKMLPSLRPCTVLNLVYCAVCPVSHILPPLLFLLVGALSLVCGVHVLLLVIYLELSW